MYKNLVYAWFDRLSTLNEKWRLCAKLWSHNSGGTKTGSLELAIEAVSFQPKFHTRIHHLFLLQTFTGEVWELWKFLNVWRPMNRCAPSTWMVWCSWVKYCDLICSCADGQEHYDEESYSWSLGKQSSIREVMDFCYCLHFFFRMCIILFGTVGHHSLHIEMVWLTVSTYSCDNTANSRVSIISEILNWFDFYLQHFLLVLSDSVCTCCRICSMLTWKM